MTGPGMRQKRSTKGSQKDERRENEKKQHVFEEGKDLRNCLHEY